MLCQYQAWQRLRILDLALIVGSYKVQCLYCEKSFDRLDNCKRHMKDAHSEAAKRKAEDSAELARLELLRTNKVPHLDVTNR